MSRFIRYDRERLRAFGHFVWQRFVDDKCFETAGALSYTTLFALVPLTAVVIGMLTSLPSFTQWTTQVSDFLFRNFVPATGEAVQHYIFEFAGNASKLTGIGGLILFVSALMLISSIEERFNRIWRVSARRSPLSRFLMYWAALTLGPILMVAGLGITSYLMALPFLGPATQGAMLKRYLLGTLPFIVTLIALFSMYRLIPNRRVPWRHAAMGALLGATLFEVAKRAFGAYVQAVPSYEQIYGTLAAVPLFLVWIFFSWVIVLLGASVAASLSAFEYRPQVRELPAGAEFVGLLHVLKHFASAQRCGEGLDEDELRRREPFLTDDLLQRYLDDLQEATLVQRSEDEAWFLVRSLDTSRLADLYEAGRYRLPLDHTGHRELLTSLPRPMRELLQSLSHHLTGTLSAPLNELLPVTDPQGPPEHCDVPEEST
ncbi:YihY family inner membrane protein [Oleiagrimonas sp. C23AA]|uniref:YihY family inner membrane protein n=1 Tax=Oleiagrimonas sp. C23AA TaxID=2719047 RepID=UPI00141DE705|nr:YihY family inner membrane protein [Oleiagrimonas sp. C23AA]NII11581.1 YihY family inner membrane protein [Oleiagrimonas sp. C23AA]